MHECARQEGLAFFGIELAPVRPISGARELRGAEMRWLPLSHPADQWGEPGRDPTPPSLNPETSGPHSLLHVPPLKVLFPKEGLFSKSALTYMEKSCIAGFPWV